MTKTDLQTLRNKLTEKSMNLAVSNQLSAKKQQEQVYEQLTQILVIEGYKKVLEFVVGYIFMTGEYNESQDLMQALIDSKILKLPG